MRQALELALEALEDYVEEYGPHEKDSGAAYAITAIKEALAQPEQEQQIDTLKRCLFQMQEAAKDLVEQAKSLPPPQRTWVGLTYEEQEEIVLSAHSIRDAINKTDWKLKEKNT